MQTLDRVTIRLNRRAILIAFIPCGHPQPVTKLLSDGLRESSPSQPGSFGLCQELRYKMKIRVSK